MVRKNYILHISKALAPSLREQIMRDVENHISLRNFTWATVPYYGMREALEEVLHFYQCKEYFFLSSVDPEDEAITWLNEEYKFLADICDCIKEEED